MRESHKVSQEQSEELTKHCRNGELPVEASSSEKERAVVKTEERQQLLFAAGVLIILQR